jgi:anti-sigma-K factor RskA
MNIGAEQLIDYLSGELDAAQRREVEEALGQRKELRTELEHLKMLREEMNKLPLYQPGRQLRSNFQAMVEEEKKRQIPNTEARVVQWKVWRRRIISAAAILLIGALTGLLIQNHRIQRRQIAAIQAELEATRQHMDQLLTTNSTAKRIQAVYMSMDLPQADQAIIDRLIELIHEDESANVRLTAIEALIQFDQGLDTQQALTSALRTEDKPVVQIALIHALVKIKAKGAIPILDELIDQEDAFDKVKDEARLAEFKLS